MAVSHFFPVPMTTTLNAKQPYHRTRIKICGFTRESDARDAIALGVDALGFVFYHKSKRAVTPESVAWMKNLPSFVQCVALFVDADTETVRQVITHLPIATLQFHGNESPAFCRQFPCHYLKAVPMQNMDARQATQYMQAYRDAAGFLLDNYGADAIGGSGTAFDWSKIPQHCPAPLVMAGGLNADNVGEVIRACRPYAVDLSSAVETAPGIKSAEKMAAFVAAVQAADLSQFTPDSTLP